VLEADARDERCESRGLFPLVSPVAKVEVVHDLGDLLQRLIVAPHARQQNFEGAEIAFVGELGVEHVEAELPGLGFVPFGLDVLELRFGIDEAADQPRASDAVDVDPLSGDPGPTSHVRQRRHFGPALGARRARRAQLVLGGLKQALEGSAARRTEVIDGDDLLEQMMALTRCSPPEVDVIVAEDLSRVTRDLADGAMLFRRLQDEGLPPRPAGRKAERRSLG
jgi:hypothetical protein